MPEEGDEDSFDYGLRLVFNGLYGTDVVAPHAQDDDIENRESLKERLKDRLFEYETGRPGDPGMGYEEVDLSELTQIAVEEGRLESRERDALVPISQNVISYKYIKEAYDTREIVDESGDSQERMVRSYITTYLFWDFPNFTFIKGSKNSADATAADTQSALAIGGGDSSISSDGGDMLGVNLDQIEFDSHFLLWIVYKDYLEDLLGNDVYILRISDAEAEGGDEQDFFGLRNQVGESVNVIRSTPFIEAISQNKKPTMIEGIFSLAPFNLKVKIHNQSKVEVKAQHALEPQDKLRRMLIALYFLRNFIELYEQWKNMDPNDRFVPPSFIEELHEIAEVEGIKIERSAEPIVSELLERRGETLDDWPNLDFGFDE